MEPTYIYTDGSQKSESPKGFPKDAPFRTRKAHPGGKHDRFWPNVEPLQTSKNQSFESEVGGGGACTHTFKRFLLATLLNVSGRGKVSYCIRALQRLGMSARPLKQTNCGK